MDTKEYLRSTKERNARPGIDPILLEIYWSRAIAIANEMMAALIRTSFSTVIRVNRDCSAAIFDEAGSMLAQSEHSAPAHIGCMHGAMKRILAHYGAASIRPGDAYITNDPWIGAGHSPDVYVASPVFRGDQLIGFTVTVAHHLDIGGRMGSTDSQDVFEEGLLLPVLKLYNAGERNDDVFRIIAENVRMPHVVLGDLDAQLAANQVGANRLVELAQDYDLRGFEEIAHAVTEMSEKAMRAAIRALPDGEHHYREDLEMADENGKPIRICLKIRIKGDQVYFDYDGTSPQVRRPINSVLNYTITFSVLALKMALAPNVPYNEGIQRPVVVDAPAGSILNALRPAAVWRRTVLGMRLPDIIFKTLAEVMPDKVIAGNGSCPMWLWLFSGWRPDLSRFVFQTHFMGGLGAGDDNDGLHTAAFPFTVTDSPVEVFENACPVIVAKRELVQDSGGAGQFRGGLGQEITLRPAPPDLGQVQGALTLAYSAGHIRSGAEGLDGGHAGATGRISINDKAVTGNLATIKIGEQDDVTFRLPGGGGYHSPLKRAPEAVQRDVIDGYVSLEAARSIYGVVINAASLAIDHAGTEALRESMGTRATTPA